MQTILFVSNTKNIQTIAHIIYDYLLCHKGTKSSMEMIDINFRVVFTWGSEVARRMAVSEMFYVFLIYVKTLWKQ